MQTKCVLITGCSSGFGRLMLDMFLDDEWEVFASTRSSDLVETYAAKQKCHLLPYDVSVQGEREKIVHTILDKSPNGLNCLVNNAGYGLAGPLAVLTDEQIRNQFEVNFFAPLFLTRDLLPALYQAKGRVINISSVLGFIGMPMQSLYAASKFALEGLSESLYYELSPHGIHVTLVEPGGFRTNFAKRMDLAETSSLDHHSPYSKHYQGYQNFLTRVSTKGNGNDPADVAKTVFKIANSHSHRLRVRVGNDSQALYYLRRYLPQVIADKILTGVSRKLMTTPQ